MVAAVVADQCKPQLSPIPLRRSPRKRRPSRVMIEAMESSARIEPLTSIDESNKAFEEDDTTREIGVGREHVVASKGSSKYRATERNGDHKLASLDGEEPLIVDIDVCEDATPEPKPGRTQQAIPDASRDARLDVDLGSMTAQVESGTASGTDLQKCNHSSPTRSKWYISARHNTSVTNTRATYSITSLSCSLPKETSLF